MFSNQVYGTRFRKQHQKRSRWAQGLVIGLGVICFGYMATILYGVSGQMCTGYHSIPGYLLPYAGRAVGLMLGLFWWLSGVHHWRKTIFQSGPLRDLVTTPATATQLLRIALKPNWKGAESIFLGIAFVMLMPWFIHDWLNMIGRSGRDELLVLTYPICALMALAFGLIIKCVMDALALAWTLSMSACGLGGVTPRYPGLSRAVKTFIGAGLLVLALTLLTMVFAWVSPTPPNLPYLRPWWTWGQDASVAMRDPGTLLYALSTYFPTSLWFEAVSGAFTLEASIFLRGVLGTLAWGAAGTAVVWLVKDRALSMPERAAWHGEPNAPKPADADGNKFKRREYDPDQVSGPIESWLLKRYSRMSRAVLRLMLRNAYVGNIDRMLWRSLKAVPPCVVFGWFSILVVAPLIVFVVRDLLGAQVRGEAQDAHVLLGSAWVVGIAFYRMLIWSGQGPGTGVGLHTSFQVTDARANYRANVFDFKTMGQTTTNARGDIRYPLQEIYAAGFNDTLLFPTFYTLGAAAVIAGLALVEGMLLGLPRDILVWGAVISVPAIGQVYYCSALVGIAQYWTDYRRAFWPAFGRAMLGLMVGVALLIGVGVLITYLCYHSIMEWETPWVAWLGSVNILLIFNVALFMMVRLVYVRRRWDAEKPPHARS